MDDRRKIAIEAALWILDVWYSTYEDYRAHPDPVIRSDALSCKARGLVFHDRALAQAEERLHG